MRTTFRDADLQRRFEADGYVVVPLLDPTALAALGGLWAGLGIEVPSVHRTAEHPLADHRRRVDQHVKAATAPALDDLFDRHRPLVAGFVAQAAGTDTAVPDTIDRTVVDERSCVSAGVWVPLRTSHGGFGVIRRSHATVHALRGWDFPTEHDMRTIGHRFEDEDRTVVRVEAGEAVVYDQRMVHFSPPNDQGRERVAVAMTIVPREAPTFHHHLHPDGRVERFRVSDQFHVAHDREVRPREFSLGYVAREFACSLPEPREPVPPRPRATFSDPDLQRTFEQEGFVRVPLISAAEVEDLHATWERISTDHGPGFHAGLASTDHEYRTAANAAITSVVGTALKVWLDDHRPSVGTFVVKSPGDASEVGPHQDWTFVDETRFSAVLAWCPLVDTDEDNGTLRVVPGSHRWAANPRGTPSIPFPYQSLWGSILEEDSVSVPVRAGEAIILDERLVHCSSVNRSGQVRVAVGCGALPSEAEVRHLFIDEEGNVDVYRVDDLDFFQEMAMGERPEGLEVIERLRVDSLDLQPFDQERFDLMAGRRLPVEHPADEPDPASSDGEAGADHHPVDLAAPPPPDAPSLDPSATAPEESLPAEAPPASPSLPTLRRRLWNVLPTGTREQIHRAWAALPGPVRGLADPRKG